MRSGRNNIEIGPFSENWEDSRGRGELCRASRPPMASPGIPACTTDDRKEDPMPLIMQQQNVKAGETAIFNYNTPVDRWVVGISYWDFEMEKRDHHVRTLALNLQVNKQQPSPQQSVITARVDGTLDDDSAHHIAFATSSVT